MIPRHIAFAPLFLALAVTPAWADKLDDDLAAAKAALLADDADTAIDRLYQLHEDARKATAANPGDAHAHYILGMAAMYAGEDATAQRSLDLATRLEPKNPRYTFGRAELASYQNRPQEAAAILQRFLQQDPQNVEAWDLLGIAQLEARQPAQARESFEKAVALAPKNPKYQTRLADVAKSHGKIDDAVKAYENALAIDPKFAPALTALGDLMLREKNYEKAVAAFKRAVDADPKDYRSLARQIQIHQATGNIKERDAALEKIRTLHATGTVAFATFCREQLSRGTSTLMAFEYFGEKGAQPAALYAFMVLGPDGKQVTHQLQLAIARDGANANQYQLISDTEKPRRVLKTFPTKPTYEEARKAVLEFLDAPAPATQPARGGA